MKTSPDIEALRLQQVQEFAVSRAEMIRDERIDGLSADFIEALPSVDDWKFLVETMGPVTPEERTEFSRSLRHRLLEALTESGGIARDYKD